MTEQLWSLLTQLRYSPIQLVFSDPTNGMGTTSRISFYPNSHIPSHSQFEAKSKLPKVRTNDPVENLKVKESLILQGILIL